jgi:glycosyltransferase involved in cell wall biosynthesis
MYFSLVCATINRVLEVDNLLFSLSQQTFKDFEVIVVDQNDDNRLENTLKKYESLFLIKHIKNNIKGASLNRNIGLSEASGDIIGFPDDDCEYPENILEIIKDYFINNPELYFFTVNSEDKITKVKRYKSISRKITILNSYRSGIEYSFFMRIKPYKCFFDNKFGIGAEFANCEVSELILHLLHKRYLGIFYGQYSIYHPNKNYHKYGELAFNYGIGFGALYKKAIIHYHFYYLFFEFLYYLLRNIAGFIFSKDKKYFFNSLKGKLVGFIKYKIK